MNCPPCVSAITFVSAAVSVVFPWSTCPIVPTFTCGLLRSNFSFDMTRYPRNKLLFDDGVGDVGWHFHVLLELHGEGRATLTHGTHRRGITKHFGQGHFAGNHLAGRAFVHSSNLSPPAIEVADHIARVLLGGDHLDFHDGLEQDRLRLAKAILEAHGAGDLEGHLVRVDVVVGTVEGRDLDIDHRISGDDTRLDRFFDALVHSGDELPRNRTADDAVHEFITLSRVGLELEPDVTILSAAAGLPDELALGLHFPANGLAIRDLRLADVGLDLEFALHAIDDDFKVQLAHSGNDRLPGLLVRGHAE